MTPPAGTATNRSRRLIVGNWKMNLTHADTVGYLQKLARGLPARYYHNVEVVVLPPFTAIRSAQTMVLSDGFMMTYGAQDVSQHESGAYTGEVSGAMLAELRCRYVVVGHSERRQHHHEDDTVVNAKVRAALAHGIPPILCVGEGLEVRDADSHIGHCTAQLTAALEKVIPEEAATVVVAYEPVWAIGTGRVAGPSEAQEVCAALRTTLGELYGQTVAGAVRVLYGGSVKSDNIGEIVAERDIDGALIGGASIDPDEFAKLCAIAAGGSLR
ncbi:MAG: triose-phosphate isomerase [Pseudonocardia sp. SCN 73-27]|uniref:triose-phosphate isomerase n=1 Tax=Pseudonocardia sp. SCN 73-27 TaxID=1660132 RepID=UPI00086CFD1E|nr:triose-phosphate isomerase [Pseudonocardia sp. SCN 73-27]ODU98913.1 MAG: triose-phosphate isomerase [Pseudonocardia sp. SCN 73-27]